MGGELHARVFNATPPSMELLNYKHIYAHICSEAAIGRAGAGKIGEPGCAVGWVDGLWAG